MGKNKKHYVIVPGDGDPCPRCGQPTEIREHDAIRPKHRHQPFYYSRWFFCQNKNCQTKQIMPSRFIVWNLSGKQRERFEARMAERRETERKVASGELVVWGDTWEDAPPSDERPPWE